MELDWAEVERLVKPSPNYADIPRRLLDVFAYDFVRKHYNHNMSEAQTYAARLLGSDPRQRYGAMLDEITRIFQRLQGLGVNTTQEFILSVENRQKLEVFYKRSQFPLDSLIGVLHYLLYWVLPARIYLRELVEPEDQQQLAYVTALRESGVRFNLDMLEMGCTCQFRGRLARITGVPEEFIFDLTNRADFTRLPYVRGSTVRNYFNAGYTSLEKLAQADLGRLQADMDCYAASIGKNLKHGMELDSGIVIAGILPKIVNPRIARVK
jgi:hypothetical protein